MSVVLFPFIFTCLTIYKWLFLNKTLLLLYIYIYAWFMVIVSKTKVEGTGFVQMIRDKIVTLMIKACNLS